MDAWATQKDGKDELERKFEKFRFWIGNKKQVPWVPEKKTHGDMFVG